MEKWGAYLLLLLAMFGCTAKSDRPVPLLDDFRSRSTIEAVRAQLEQHGAKFEITEDDVSTRTDISPYRHTRVRVEGFVSRGQHGTLQLEFYNDQLMATTFYPVHLSTYLEMLGANGIKLTDRERSTRSAGASIELLNDYQGRWYVRWSDPDLMKAMRDWIARNA